MPFTDPRLPGKEYKTERGMKAALTALAKRETKTTQADTAVPLTDPALHAPQVPTPAPYAGPYFIRNIRHVPVRVRFSGKDGRSVKLEPRGSRNDMMQLQPSEEYDAALNDIGVLFEALTAEQASKVIGQQATNQQALHPALAHLLSPTGQQMGGGVVVEEEAGAQGKLVGTVRDQGPNEKNQKRQSIQRVTVDEATGPRQANVLGSRDNPIPSVSGSVPAEEQAAYVQEQGGIQALMARDAQARQKGVEGPQAGLGGLRVGGIEPPAPAPIVQTRLDDLGIDPVSRTPNDPVTGAERLG